MIGFLTILGWKINQTGMAEKGGTVNNKEVAKWLAEGMRSIDDDICKAVIFGVVFALHTNSEALLLQYIKLFADHAESRIWPVSLSGREN